MIIGLSSLDNRDFREISKMKLLIYMPAYNEETNIQSVIATLPKILPEIDIIQYLVVDDGSFDRTAEFASGAGALVISHKNNQGVGAAFHSAVQFALEHGADILVSIDADGQFNPGEIPNLIEPILSKKADMVIGNRFLSGCPQNMPKVKYWGNQQVSRLISYVSGREFQDVSCGYRAYNRETLLHLNLFGSFTYTHETILSSTYQGLSVSEYPVSVQYDPGRQSRVAKSILQYAYQTSKIIFRVLLDYNPMRVFGTIGGILIFIGSGFIFFLLGHYFFTHSFTPYKSFGFIGLGFVIFGLLVFLMAFIADMINRIRVNEDRLLYELRKNRYSK